MRPIELEDLFRFRLAGDVQIAPDGRRIAFTLKRVDEEKNKYFTRIMLSDPESGDARDFTGGDHNDTSPRWSPDGKRIAFVSDRAKPKSQIYLIPSDGGEARPLTDLEEGGFSELTWSPDGTRIAFFYRETPEMHREKPRKEREEKGASFPARVHTKLFYRLDGVGYWDGSVQQLWVVDAATGETRKLTDEPHHLHSLVWSPDGERLLFVANRREDDDIEINYEDIWSVPVAGGEITKVDAPDGPKSALACSPDGKWIAYVGHTDPLEQWGGLNMRVLVIPAEGAAEARDLTGHTDRNVGWDTLSDVHEVEGGQMLRWTPDSAAILAPISARGDTRLYRIPLDGEWTPLTPSGREMGSYSLSTDGARLAVQLSDWRTPAEAFVGEMPASGEAALRQVTRLNPWIEEEIALQEPEELEVESTEGARIHAWMLRPAGFTEGGSYPAVVYVHGGPAAQYGGRSVPFHELQLLAASGYVVLFSNPRGSRGYGEEHTRIIKGDWGNRDFADVEAVADYGTALPFVDADRMGIMGGSYGGFMTAWAVGHTDRYRCAITDRLVNNIHSFSGTVDFPWQHGRAWKGNAWDDPSDMWRSSPLASAGRINTPLLIIHSDGDLRCPVSQAEELFAALRYQRKTVEFVRYPASSSHGLSRTGPPDLRADRLRRNLAWLDRWLKAS
jgi:dipeptidyl aminopeptidase/acylaminoacyl peptidase